MEQFLKFYRKYLLVVGGPYASAILRELDAGGLAGAQGLKGPSPRAYRTSSDYGRDALAFSLIKKLRLPTSERARALTTLDDFWISEHQCRQTNDRIRHLSRCMSGRTTYSDSDLIWAQVLEAWRREIAAALGRLPLRLEPSFSGGSTLSDRGKQTTIPDKLSSTPTIYPRGAAVWAHSVAATVLDKHRPVLVRSNEYFTVPKDSTKERACCMEASGSLMLQLAVGKLLKSRYKRRYGVDLARAKEIHMEAARAASVSGTFATIDLSRASDTIGRELVRALLPPLWAELLESLRATHTSVGGKHVYLEKYSSMGNGFTFELESILFRSLAAVLTNAETLVFGDDIIIEAASADVMIHALEYFGFTPNMKKTFCEGPFRESCGGDYFEGQAVRPPFLEELPSEPQHWIALANSLHRVGLGKTAAWWNCVDQVPLKWRVFGPAHLGDLCFTSDDAEPKLRPNKATPGQLAPYWTIMVPVSRTFRVDRHFDYAVVVSAATLGCKTRVAVRNSVTGYRKRFVLAYGLA